ncbi:acyltransferase family protein [Neobacillus sp. NRS-1170]|uniref:acyltransferase family protein n=1 Tax=Neobacillus sp. NRS-1170 TaxID=3233898 RepID=UPI003D297788
MTRDTRFLHGFRFFLALWVALAHFYVAIGGPKFIDLGFAGGVLLSASVAVDGFIVLTGFLMGYTYKHNLNPITNNYKETILYFWVRRLFRLYPVYILSIIVAYLLVGETSKFNAELLYYFTGDNVTPWGTERNIENVSILNLLSHITFIHGFIPNYVTSILPPAWSMSIEIQYYIVFPFLYLWLFSNGRRIKKYFLFILTLFLLLSFVAPKLFGLYLTPGSIIHYGQPSLLIYKLPLFILGTVMALVIKSQLKIGYFIITLLAVMFVQSKLTNFIISILVIFMFLENLKKYTGKTIYTILNSIKKLLSTRLAEVGANISYSLYLVHMITLPLILKLVVNLINFPKIKVALVSLVLFISVTFLISYLLYYFIEKPFILLGKKIIILPERKGNKKRIDIKI